MSSLRVVGVTVADVRDWREPLPAGKWSQFFAALAPHVSTVHTVTPRVSESERWINLALSVRPTRARWRGQAGFNLRHLARVNAALRKELFEREGSYDLIVQLQTLCTPRSDSVRRPYVIYTDNTMALTQRLYPPFAPVTGATLRGWLEFEANVCRNASAVFTFSEFARRSVVEDYLCPPERVVAVGAGANQLATALEGKDYSRPRALFVGAPFEPKGGEVLLAAWQHVRRRVPRAELVIVGPKRNPVNGFGSGVIWLGHLSRADLAEQYRSASVFVLPSLFDAWGHVFVEAMGHGLPCIGSNCCAMPEIIEHAVSGLLVPRGDSRALAATLTELLTDPDKAARMGQAGHARVVETLTWRHVVDRVVSHLRGSLLSAP